MNFVLFETTESIVEVLWDIALAFFIVRLAFIYFALTFVSSASLLYLAHNYPSLLPTTTHNLVAPSLLLTSLLCAYAVVSHWQIPRVAAFRLATGGVALLYMLLADAAVRLGLWEYDGSKWMAQWVGEKGVLGSGSAGLLLVGFALMPTALMVLEGRGKKESDGEGERQGTWHGHEEKSIVDAVPTVNVSGKEKRQ